MKSVYDKRISNNDLQSYQNILEEKRIISKGKSLLDKFGRIKKPK